MALKHSKQRDMIKEFLMGRKDHPTADVVYANVHMQYPNISLGTVYRNLSLLADLGEIKRLRLGDGVDHFDADTSPHYHFICSECGSVIDLKMDSIETITDIAGADFDGQIAGHVTYFYGTCGNCSKVQSAAHSAH
jgi:Fur family peroxide stress response transcriptional regulator